MDYRMRFTLAISLGVGALGACGRARDIDDASLRAADADSSEWLSYGRTYSEQRYSPLRQIDEQSVSRLESPVEAGPRHTCRLCELRHRRPRPAERMACTCAQRIGGNCTISA